MTKFITIVTFTCIQISFWVSLSTAEDLTPLKIAQNLQDSYDKTTSLSADFQQVTSNSMSSRERHGAGRVYLAKPGLMRWDYTLPDQQVFVCDGMSISMYFAKEKQMMVSSAKQYLESDVTYSFFAGSGNIIRDFEIAAPLEDEIDPLASTVQIKITPKSGHPQVAFVNLWADQATFLLKRVKVVDKFGNVTDITFSNIEQNNKISKDIFKFTPPEGTEIVEQ